MDGKAGRENCCTLAEKALPKVGQTKYRLFQRNMFTHNLLQRSMVAAIMDGKVGWENGRAGLCAGISFEIPLFQVALMEASLAALRMVRAEKLSHNTSLFAEI